jgi:pre-mRNA-splicing factor ATP-dependent RNA helicase DHX15/PRP43
VATNIAETSLTISSVVFVIDSGLAKRMVHNPRLRVEMLQTVVISKAAANQRAGRTGRTQPGECYKMYTEDDYDYLMPATTPPAIKIEETARPTLQLIRAGHTELCRVDWIDPPTPENPFRLWKSCSTGRNCLFLGISAANTIQGHYRDRRLDH